MKKLFTVLFLVVIIAITLGFISLRVLAQGDEESNFNRNYRSKLSAYPIVRKMLGMHFDGDGKADYLGNSGNEILIEVDSLIGLQIDSAPLKLLAEKISAITGKEAFYLFSDSNIAYKESLNRDDIKEIVKTNRDYKKPGSFYVLIASKDMEVERTLGITFEEYGVVIFADRIDDFTMANPETKDNYIESTILHEFGHQIGLPHNDLEGCLMNEKAEESQVARENPNDVLVDFCDYEKEQVRLNKM